MQLDMVSEKVSRLAKMLASDELKTRKLGHKLALKLLRVKAKTENSKLTYENILGVCKGLYYSLWMQDKLLLQEDTVERIVKLLPMITSRETRVSFVSAMFETLAREWENLDVWRADKFMMLAREFFVKALMCTKKRALPVSGLTNAVFDKVLNSDPNAAIDLKVHLCTVVAQELTQRKDFTAVILSFYKHTLAVLLQIPRGNDYITSLTRLLLILTRLVRANRSVRSELSENALLLSSKHPLHRGTLLRISKILHVKMSQKSKSSTDQTGDLNALPNTSAQTETAAPETGVKVSSEENPSEPSCDPAVTTSTTTTAVTKRIKKKRRKGKHAPTTDFNAGATGASVIPSVDNDASATASKLGTEKSQKCEKIPTTFQPTKPSPKQLPRTSATEEETKASTESSLNGKNFETDSAFMETPNASLERRKRKRRRSSSLTEAVATGPAAEGQSSTPTPSGLDLTPQMPKPEPGNHKRRRELGSVDLDASPENKVSSAPVAANTTNTAKASTISTTDQQCTSDEAKQKAAPVNTPTPDSLVVSASPSKSLKSPPPTLPSLPTMEEVTNSTDTMLADFDDSLAEPPVSAKKRVSFGKVFRKRFSANRSLTISPSLTALPDRGILRQQSS
ncbi:Ribosomal RNA processing protein 1 B [Sparganum proliferum]